MAALARAACLAALVLAGAAHAQPVRIQVQVPNAANSSDSVIAFDIAAQEMGAALDEYGRLTGLAVLVDSEVARRSAPAVHGRYAAAEALQRLLAGTGLQAHYMNARSIVVNEAPAAAPREPSPGAPMPAPAAVANLPGVSAGDLDQQHYLARVQTALRVALCRSKLTRPGDYRLALQLRLNASGAVERMHLLGTSGSAARDAAVARLLGKLDVGAAPPATLPQPVLLLLLPEGPQAEADCPAPPLPGLPES